ncbi:ThiF family adenylyltransferase [Kitasatospora sp. NPDC085879]|uniref:HesA/MoeB/ThiF family protein n=1 Tax=Kitasatospora sp. NPDC085879 TaxID=3154769 RepID=UPI00341C9A90
MRRPTVKYEHLPYRPGHSSVRIGDGVYGLAAEIRDPHGWVWTALALMDGTRTRADLVDDLRTHCPDLPEAGAARLVDSLVATGYVEDAAADDPADLSSAERDRYRRNREFFRMVDLRPQPGRWDAQLSLKQAGVVVLGLGGTGSHAAWALAAAGVGRVHCVDPDVVERANLARQVLYTEDDLGQPKAGTAARRLRAVNSEIAVSHECRAVDSPEALADLVTGYHALALCADEPDSEALRGWASEACARTGVPWVGGGYDGPYISVGVFGPQGPCFQCLAAGEEARLPRGPAPRLGGNGVIGPSAAISGNLVAYEIIALLTGISRIPPGYLRGLNLIVPDEPVLIRHPARPGCRYCSAAAARRAGG